MRAKVRLTNCDAIVDFDFQAVIFQYHGRNPADLVLTLKDLKDLLEVMTRIKERK